MRHALCIGLLLLLAGLALADRGSIPYKPNVQIFEPNQRAMIAWDGKEEILLLTTNLRAAEETKVLEVIPLPNKPVVTKGDVKTFAKATDLINRKLAERVRTDSLGHGRGPQPKAAAAEPGGVVVTHKVIGAHDISVIKVLNKDAFIDWVQQYLKKDGVDTPVIPEIMQTSIAAYLKENYKWFVFDVVALTDKPITNDAIQYRFASDHLFYPMKISRTDTGNTTVDLLILTPRLLSNFTGIPIKDVKLRHDPIAITSKELRELNADMDDLFKHRNDLKLRIWQIQGDLKSFNKDLIAKP